MAPAYKLTYFDITGLAEPTRFLLSYGGIEFEDKRVEMDKDWPSLKPNMPFGKIPVLEYNGKIGHQSVALARYVAKQVNLVGKDPWEDLEIDATVDTVNDLQNKLGDVYYEPEQTAKNEAFFKETLPYYLEKLDAQAKRNNGYLAAGRLTWADLYFISLLDMMNVFAGDKNIIANAPNLQAVKEHVLAVPNIKAWIEKRPPKIYF